MKRLLSSVGLLLALVLAGCSSSGDDNGNKQAGTVTLDSCRSLAGQPVGKIANAHNPNGGHLVNPPKACASEAVLSNLRGCYPKDGSMTDYFYYETPSPIYVVFGKPGGVWHVHKGELNEAADEKTIDC